MGRGRGLPSLELTKRHKFVAISGFCAAGLIAIQTVPYDLRYGGILALTSLSSLLTLAVLWKEMAGVKYWMLLILPSAFTAAVSLFYFLLPVRWATRLPVAVLFGISFYLLLLTLNIFNVAAIRTIALLRAAHAVGVLFTLISAFFIFNVYYSLHLNFLLLFLLIFVTSFVLLLQALWAFELEDLVSRRVLLYTAVYALSVAEIGLTLGFWPIVPIYGSLALTSALYVFLGLTQVHFTQRLTKRAVWEYVLVAASTVAILLLTSKWG